MPSSHAYTIVVGIDFSDLSDHALDQALEMASLRAGAEVHVVYVEPDVWAGAAFAMKLDSALDADTAVRELQQRATARVAQMPDRLEKQRIHRVVAHFRRGPPAENVAQLAADLDADLVVVGSHARPPRPRAALPRLGRRARLAFGALSRLDRAAQGSCHHRPRPRDRAPLPGLPRRAAAVERGQALVRIPVDSGTRSGAPADGSPRFFGAGNPSAQHVVDAA